MATQRALSIAFTTHGGPPLQLWYDEAASQTFLKGEAVYLDGAGNVAEFTTALDNGTQRFLGFAAGDGHNDTTAATNRIGVYILDPGTVFEANVTTGAGSDQVTAKTQIGSIYRMNHNTTLSIVQIDIGATGDNIECFRIVGFSTEKDVGETNGRAWVTAVGFTSQLHDPIN